MTIHAKGPPSGGEGGPLELSFPGGNDFQPNGPTQGPAQAISRVVQFPPRIRPPRPRRHLTVRIAVSDGRTPIGRTRALNLTEHDFAWLLEAAERLEARRA